MRVTALAMLVWMALLNGVSYGQLVVTLNMTQLPSNQAGFGPNWTFVSGPATPLPQTPTFSVGLNSFSQPTLFMNTLPDDLSSPDSTTYALDGILDPAQPVFQVNMRAAVLVEESAGGNHFGLNVTVGYGGRRVGIGFGPAHLQAVDSLGVTTLASGLDNTGYHDYQLNGNVTTGAWSFTRDSILMGSGTMLNDPTFNRVLLGDGSGGANVQAEITHFTLTSVPEPSPLMLLALAVAIPLLREYRQRARRAT